jgi:AmmeMemoRadiSam system protein A
MPVKAAFAAPHPPVILPDIGRGGEERVRATIDALDAVAGKISEIRPRTIIVSSPHAPGYADAFCFCGGKSLRGDMSGFYAPQLQIDAECDGGLLDLIIKEAENAGIPVTVQKYPLDHGTVVPLMFVNAKYSGYKLIVMGLSGLSAKRHYDIGKCIAKAAEISGKDVVFLASGDLSHKTAHDGPYGFSQKGVEFDKEITDILAKGELNRLLSINQRLVRDAAQCGLNSLIIMAGALDGKKVTPELLSYQGVLGVGYAVAQFIVENGEADKNAEKIQGVKSSQNPYVALAKYSVEYYVTHGKKAPIPGNLPGELTNARAGVFVSLKINGNLRGCIGTIAPYYDSIAEEIIENAISACARDPRFYPVAKQELPQLEYSVDVLMPLQPVDSMDMLDVKKYGVIVSFKGRRGLLLPDLEGVDTPQQQVLIALNKAGIPPREKYKLERFEVVRHK